MGVYGFRVHVWVDIVIFNPDGLKPHNMETAW